MENIKTIFFLFITVSLLSCNSNSEKKKAEENNKGEFQQYEAVFEEIKEHLAKENGQLWNHQLYGPILLVDQRNQLLIANES